MAKEQEAPIVFLMKGASRELDRIVAEAFMGIDPKDAEHEILHLPFFSSNYDDAWQMILMLRACKRKMQDVYFHNLKMRVYKKFDVRWKEVDLRHTILWATPLDFSLAALDTCGIKYMEKK